MEKKEFKKVFKPGTLFHTLQNPNWLYMVVEKFEDVIPKNKVGIKTPRPVLVYFTENFVGPCSCEVDHDNNVYGLFSIEETLQWFNHIEMEYIGKL